MTPIKRIAVVEERLLGHAGDRRADHAGLVDCLQASGGGLARRARADGDEGCRAVDAGVAAPERRHHVPVRRETLELRDQLVERAVTTWVS